MVFEDNFVYPFPNAMYDPVLKVRVSVHAIREAGPELLRIGIYHDPEIEADHLTVPVSEETKARWRSSPLRRHKADDDSMRWPFISDKDVKIEEQPCHWEQSGEVVRLKVSSKSKTFLQVRRIVQNMNIPRISEDPLSFFLYIYKKSICLRELENEYYTKSICPDAKRAEICLNADAFLNAFGLSPGDYSEVEPGWYCLASKELAR